MSQLPWSDLGIVSNCWRVQLEQGEPLEHLVDRAEVAGLRHVELRQGCLGEMETIHPTNGTIPLRFPVPSRLAELARQHPIMRFNLALDLPFLSAPWSSEFLPLIETAIDAARALANRSASPHLRLVDLRTSSNDFRNSLAEGRETEIAHQIAQLARRMKTVGGTLSIENSRQDWKSFWQLFQTARRLLQDDANSLQICYDPCNLLAAEDRPRPEEVTRQLNPAEISMIHFKQRDHAGPTNVLREGNVDWTSVIAALRTINYRGPALFEIESSPDIWQCLAQSQSWIEHVGKLSDTGSEPANSV